VITAVEVAEVPDPTPGPRQVVVDVAACGLCGTDLHILQGEFAPTLPVVARPSTRSRRWRTA
jgi:D-arabinose 1-dehydrogenase-like Zn-dependent alcohol dehydrogenase